ncbi:MAG: hypothetical protein JW801_18200 [Bacteroidales bacterium]|nr:hypothetical protein [Bacteroidales bacterium]
MTCRLYSKTPCSRFLRPIPAASVTEIELFGLRNDVLTYPHSATWYTISVQHGMLNSWLVQVFVQ